MDDGTAVVVFALCHIQFQVLAMSVCFARRTLLGQNMAEESGPDDDDQKQVVTATKHSGGRRSFDQTWRERPKNLSNFSSDFGEAIFRFIYDFVRFWMLNMACWWPIWGAPHKFQATDNKFAKKQHAHFETIVNCIVTLVQFLNQLVFRSSKEKRSTKWVEMARTV
jgi:hypothetical protein